MKKKLKIAILIDRLNVGGVEKIAIEEVRALRDLGEEGYLVVLRRKGVINNAFFDLRKDLPTIYLDDRLPSLLKFSFKFPVFNFFSLFHVTYPFIIPFILKKNEFDYFIVHGTYTAFTAISIKKIRGIKFSTFVWDPIGYILERVYSKNFFILINILKKIAYFLDQLIVNNSNYVLVGGSAHNKYIKNLNVKVVIKEIPPSVSPLNKLSKFKEDYALMVTAWKRGKDPEYIFNIIKEIPTIKIVMVGKWLDPLYEKEFRNMVIKKKFSGNIKIVGEVSEKQLSNYYSKARLLLQTNDDRGFGMPALEAAGNGTTFIIPKNQGVCKLFNNMTDGFYTKEKDTEAIVNYLNKLLNNKILAAKMGKQAWERVKDSYTWKNHAKEIAKISKIYAK